MSYVPRTPDEWRSEAGVFSRALRGLADRWDAALTNGASPDGVPLQDDLEALIQEIGDLTFEMTSAITQYPKEPV